MLPLLRSAAMDKVPPMQINASGSVVSDRYCKDFSSQPGTPIWKYANGVATITLIISGLANTLLKMLHGSDLITGL